MGDVQGCRICPVEHSPLKTTGSAGLAPVASLTSSHALPTVPQPCCFSDAPECSSLSTAALALPSTEHPRPSSFLPRLSSDLCAISPSQWSFLPPYSNCNPIPSTPCIPFLCCSYPQHWAFSNSLFSLFSLLIVYFPHQKVSSMWEEKFVCLFFNVSRWWAHSRCSQVHVQWIHVQINASLLYGVTCCQEWAKAKDWCSVLFIIIQIVAGANCVFTKCPVHCEGTSAALVCIMISKTPCGGGGGECAQSHTATRRVEC